MNDTLMQLVAPVVSYVGTAAIKWLFAKIGRDIPGIVKLVLSGLLATASTAVTGLPPGEAVATGMAGGAVINEGVKEAMNRLPGKPEGNA